MAEIVLSTGDIVLIDDEDYPLLSRHSWQRAGSFGYVSTELHGSANRYHTLYMHRLVMGGHVMVDHKDGNVLDCRKQNLRQATFSQNGANCRKMQLRKGKPTSSKYKGVFFDNRLGKFRAGVTKHKKRYDCGAYSNEDDAARAYNAKAFELHGEYARLNEIN